jgi:hypothetical protein
MIRRDRLFRIVPLLFALTVLLVSGCGSNATPAAKPNFVLTASPASLTLTAGGSTQSVTLTARSVNGFSGSMRVTVSGLPTGVTASPATLTLALGVPQKIVLSAAATAAAGSTTVQFVAVAGTLNHTVPITLNIAAAAAPDFTLTVTPASLNLTAGGSAKSVTLMAAAVNGFTGSIHVAISGLPTGVTANPATLTLAVGVSQKVSLTAAAAAAGTGTVNFVGTAGTISHTAALTLNITAAAAPDFTLTLSSASLSLTAGGSAQSVNLTAAAVNGFTGSVQVTISGLPTGVTATPATFTLAIGVPQKVSFTAAASAAAGSATIHFAGTSGTLSHTAALTLTIATTTQQGHDVVTYHYDVGRTGLDSSETTLTTANVTSSKFGLLTNLTVDGTVDAQPLYLANLTVGGQQRNVVFVETEHDSVYAFDADTGVQIWKVSVLGANETPSGDHGCGQISPEIGITSTPVIDRQAGAHGTIFVVGMSLDAAGNYHQRLHALDVTTGAELGNSPSEIQATYPGTGANSSGGNVIFDPSQYAERSGILLLNGAIYLGWTSHCDNEPYTGWLMAYSESTLAQTSVLNLTPNGSEGSIWMAGAGLAADSNNFIYFLDANGTFDTTLDANGFPTQQDYGNGFLKVSTSGGKLAVTDYFEMNNTVSESNADEDLGSGGALVLPDIQDTSGTTHHLAVGAGKDGEIYIVNRDKMGKFNPQNNSAVYQEIQGGGGGVWAMPAYFNNAVYYGAVGDTLKAYPIANAKFSGPSMQSTNTFTYPGTTPAVSANGTSNAIVWAVENAATAVLHAYDATTLQELYNSSQASGGRDHFGGGNKFITPMIANGKVYVGTPNSVAVFGLLP